MKCPFLKIVQNYLVYGQSIPSQVIEEYAECYLKECMAYDVKVSSFCLMLEKDKSNGGSRNVQQKV